MAQSAMLEQYGRVFDRIDRRFDADLAEIQRFLRQPGLSHTGEGIKESAAMALGYLQRVGTEHARLVETGGNPVVTGMLRSRSPNAPTLIVYSLYDVVPVTPADWTFPPFEARIVDATDLRLPATLGKVICGRGSMNQRGPMLAAILALEAIKEETGDIPVNVIWAWEGEEEIGSPNLAHFIRSEMRTLATADALWFPSFRQRVDGSMILPCGHRGMILLELRIRGGAWGGTLDGRDLWSGNIAFADAPYWRMIRCLATLVDADDRPTIDALWERVRPRTSEEAEAIRTVVERFDEEDWRRTLGIGRFRGGRPGRDLVERYLMDPMVNVVGISGGYTGPGVYTTLPMDVTAKLDIRLVPDLHREDIVRLLREHLDRRGFTEVEISDPGGGYDYNRTPVSDPVNQAAFRANDAFGIDYVVWPMHPAAAPLSLFNQPPLAKPCSLGGAGHGARAHSPDEYVSVEGIRDFMKWTVVFLQEFAARREPQRP